MAGVVAGHGVAALNYGAALNRRCRRSVAVAALQRVEDRSRFQRRNVLSSAVFSIPVLQQLVFQQDPAAALIEADDDEELLEKVKGDRQKRIQQREALSAFKDETVDLQNAVYQMSKAGQAIEKQDFVEAISILGTGLDTEWVSKTNAAIAKVSSSPEEQDEAEIFSSSLAALQSAVSLKDPDSAKVAFVASASALEKWSSLTGLRSQIKGL